MAEAFFFNTQKLIDNTITTCPGAEKVDFDSDTIEEGVQKDQGFITEVNNLKKSGKLTDANSRDVIGLIHDRDIVALWGDPAWEARFAEPQDGPALASSWQDDGSTSTLTLTAKRAFANPYPVWLPRRINDPVSTVKGENQPDMVVAKDFL